MQVEPGGASRPRAQNTVREAFGEDLSAAQNRLAAEAAGNHDELNDTARQRQIRRAAPVMAMHASGNCSARWTKTETPGRADCDHSHVGIAKRTVHNKPGRHQTGAAKCLLHGVDSPPMGASNESGTASNLSQSQNCTPNDTHWLDVTGTPSRP